MIQRYKAPLVILGDHQVKGLDYNETFALVAKMTSMQCFLVVTVAKGWKLHQIDVNNVLLHGDLKEEVFRQMPPRFSLNGPNKVCKLRKLLYGLC